MTDALRFAFGTLTAVPVPPPRRVDARVAGPAMLWAPLVTLVVALPMVGAYVAVRWLGMPPLVAAALSVGGMAWASRGIHLDGLADTADGLAAGYDPQRALAVMRRSDLGPAGATAIAVALLVDVACLDGLLRSGAGTAAAVVAVAASRHTLAWGCRTGMPSARTEGLGAAVVGSVSRGRLAVAALLMLGTGCATTISAGAGWRTGVGSVVAAVGAAWVLQRRARHRLGGISGDVLGAGVEAGLGAALVVAATLIG